MNDNLIFKVKDSVDLFLSNEKYIMAYYMNTRQRKSFRVNEEAVHLLKLIDGEKTLGEIKRYMNQKCDAAPVFVEQVMEVLLKNKIITEVVHDISILSKSEIERYSRQINYFAEFLDSEEAGIRAQKKLMNTKILVFGAGAIGGNIALELAMSGIENITLYDFDMVEPSDGARHLFYRESYVGMYKTDSLAKEIKKINEKANVKIINESMKPESDIENLIKESDFVVNTLDEPYIGYTSSKISRICVKYKIAHYIAGGFDAHLASTGELIIPYVTPCVECYAGHFKEILKDWKPKKHPVKNRYEEIGGLSSMTLFSSSYACIEIIKYIAGLVSMEDNYKIRGEFLFTDMSLTYLNIVKNPDCPVCGGDFE